LQNRIKLEQGLLELKRRKGLEDLFYFNEEILGNDPHINTHTAVLKYAESSTQRKLILLPRGTYKTTLITVGRILQKIAQNKNIRILIESETYDQGVDILNMIKTHIESNQLFRALYGELDKNKTDRRWREDAIEVYGRTIIDRNPTVAVGSIGKVNVGSHYDLVVADDWVSDNNINTSEQIEKVKNHWKAMHSVMLPHSELILVGTRWNYDDLYGHIIDDPALNEEYRPFIKASHNADGSLFFPEELSDKFLQLQKDTQGPYMFSCLYDNNPLPAEKQEFKGKWFKFYNSFDDIKDLGLEFYLANDPAISEKKQGCDAVTLVGGVDEDNNLYVVDYFRGQLTPDEFIEKNYAFAEEYPPVLVGIETNAFQKSLIYGFMDKAKEKNWYLPIREIFQTQDKIQRIRGIQPRFAAGKIFIRKDMKDLISDLLRFPRIAKNKMDLIDCMATLVKLIRSRAPQEEKTTVPERSFNGVMHRMKKTKKITQKMGNENLTFNQVYGTLG